jgi:ATP-dependent helicase HrpA
MTRRPPSQSPDSRSRHLRAQVPGCMLADQRTILSQLNAIDTRQRRNQPVDRLLEKARSRLEESLRRRAARLASLPRPTFPSDLPVVQRKDDIARAISENQVIVLCGETGSGKTTQLPKICLELGRGVSGSIGHTQPRRIAARSVAARIADELGAGLGGTVGYKVRFGDKTSPGTLVKVMTDGILLAETQGDPWLEQYDTLIIDEAHERGLNIDFLLGYIKRLLPRRPDLKVIVTSATIDPQRFARHFASAGKDAPIIEVSGRVYPVEVRYRPPVAEAGDDATDFDLESAVLAAVGELGRLPPGDILVFLSGERDIREIAEALRKHHPPGTEILPLYARLSAAEQQKVFEPHRGRRIILATNVAETSLTVPGIRYVIDPGMARISRYSTRTKVQRLPIEPISRASADQRKGRCGRVAEGVCIRLYSEDDYLARPQFTEPEVLRTNLASVILQMKSLRLGEVVDFPFVEPPESRYIRDGYDTLHELGAVDERGELTRIGSELARLPIDPRVGRMILGAAEENCLAEVLVIAAALSIQDPRERPMDRQDAADEAHRKFAHEDSDFLSLLNLWTFYQGQSKHLSHSKLRKACQQNYLSAVRMREWDDVYRQLHALVIEMGHHPATRPAEFDAVHRALLTGLLSNVGTKADTFEYSGTRSSRFSIFPGSGLFKKPPKWVMAAEIVQTTRLYARCVAKIQPLWIESLGAHLVKRTYSGPHWEEEKARVAAFEKVLLFGLEIVPRRTVHYGPVDPKLSRELFIHHALVEGEFHTRARFFEHNLGLRDEVEALEAKSRERNLLAEAERRFTFYDKRLPADVYSGELFEAWLKKAERENPKLLFMTLDDLLREGSGAALVTLDKFPPALPLGAGSDSRVPLSYHLEPGHPDDGVTATVPLEGLNQLTAPKAEWLVPGLLKEKITALIRSLPKQYRVRFVPAPVFAERVAESLPPGAENGPLLEILSATLAGLTGVAVPVSEWRPETLPEHLRMNFAVVDRKGTRLAAGRELDKLKAGLRVQLKQALATLPDKKFNRDGITEWDFGDLPEHVEVKHAGLAIVAYPALADPPGAGGAPPAGAGLRLFESPESARASMRGGLRRLYLCQVRDELAFQVKNLPGLDRIASRFAVLGKRDQLRDTLSLLIADRAFLADDDPDQVRSETVFRRRLDPGWSRLGAAAHEVAGLVDEILAAYHPVALELGDARAPSRLPAAWQDAMADIRSQLAALLPAGFLTTVAFDRLRHFPRYLGAVRIRLQKLRDGGPGTLSRDQKHAAHVVPHWLAYLERAAARAADGIDDPELDRFRWMIEEFRVSSFAQELGTAEPVSAKRLSEQWTRVRP